MRSSYGLTHPGKVRSVNEDCFGMFEIGQATLYVVCDGIGGHHGGKQASALSMAVFSEFVREHMETMETQEIDEVPLAHIKRMMRAAATEASRRVRAAALCDPTLEGMGSTLVAALVTDHRAFVLNVGDSRLYAVGRGGAEKVTRDHSYIQYLLDIGRISPEQVKELAGQNFITQAIGAYDHVDGDFCALELSAYESPTYLLLCSDGLYSMVSEDKMQRILLSDGELFEKVDALIDAANAAGGADNVTAVAVEVA